MIALKLKKKPKAKLVNEMLEHKKHRGELVDVAINFVSNVSMRYTLMHEILDMYKSEKIEKDYVVLAAGQYITSLISCWETFFRDSVLFIVENNETLHQRVDNFFLEKNVNLNELESSGISIGELFCKQFNFQDLNETCNALNFVLETEKEKIEEFFSIELFEDVIMYSLNFIVYWAQQKDDVSVKIGDVLHKVFEIRHKVIHDANYKIKLDSKFMTMCEDCFIVFPQLISIEIARKYKQKMLVTHLEENTMRITDSMEDEKFLLLSRKDFEAEYTLVE